MNKSDLKQGFSIFGNKGNLVSDNCHICQDGMFSTTLCRTPMLSTNWARITEHQTIGCPKCLEIYEQQTKTQWLAYSDYFQQMESGVHGSFSKSLAGAWLCADNGNRRKLVEAFPDHFPVGKYIYV